MASTTNFIMFLKQWRVLVFAIVSLNVSAISGLAAGNGESETWMRGFLGGQHSPPYDRFLVGNIASVEGNHLIGTFYFYNYDLGGGSPLAIRIHGKEKADGTFCPYVTAQVGNEIKTKWETIGCPIAEGTAVTLTVRPRSESKPLIVNLDIFRSLIGKMKYGRVLLKTGDSAIFELNDLLPPKTDN
jgi:hypothetical protein